MVCLRSTAAEHEVAGGGAYLVLRGTGQRDVVLGLHAPRPLALHVCACIWVTYEGLKRAEEETAVEIFAFRASPLGQGASSCSCSTKPAQRADIGVQPPACNDRNALTGPSRHNSDLEGLHSGRTLAGGLVLGQGAALHRLQVHHRLNALCIQGQKVQRFSGSLCKLEFLLLASDADALRSCLQSESERKCSMREHDHPLFNSRGPHGSPR